MIDVMSGEEVILTKERAIIEHRKMWKWIANQYKKGSQKDVRTLKKDYLKDKYEDVLSNCFCCEYDKQKGNNMCNKCPIIWGTEEQINEISCTANGSPYKKIVDLTEKDFDYKEAEKLAREVANLPKRK